MTDENRIPPTVPVDELILHWRKVAAQTAITPQLAHDLDARMYQDIISWTGDRMFLQMQSRVLAEKVDHVANAIALLALLPLTLCGVIAWRSLAPVTVNADFGEITVSGEVTIGADYWHTFPKNTRVYPKELGDTVRIIEYRAPDIRFEP
jgi:hypothetical protein